MAGLARKEVDMDEERVVVRQRQANPVEPAPSYSGQGMISDTIEQTTVRRQPSGAEVARRVVVFVFGIIQLLLVLRIGLLILDADKSNGLVRAIYDVSGVLVAPFEGILRTDAIGTAGSVLDIAALVALVGWTILEAVILAAISIVRREP
jgi:YGGT family